MSHWPLVIYDLKQGASSSYVLMYIMKVEMTFITKQMNLWVQGSPFVHTTSKASSVFA